MSAVPFTDLAAMAREVWPSVEADYMACLLNADYVGGPPVTTFERDWAAFCGASHSVGVANGTDAIELTLAALGIGAGDEVITSPFTFFATAGTIARTGARPAFCDIDPSTFNLSTSAVQRFIDESCVASGGELVRRTTGGRVRALMPVHLYGQAADMEALTALARRYDLAIIEDAAQAIGTETADGKRVGALGDIGCFSFFPSKNLGAFGDAGLCTTEDAALAERMRVLRVHGGQPKYFHALIGGNFRIDELQAAVLRVKLKYLDGWTQGRQRNAAFYDKAFADASLGARITAPKKLARGRHIYNQYVVRAERRDALRAFLTERHIGTEIYYPVPLHLQQCFAYLGYRAGDFPHAEAAAQQTLALPIYPELTQTQLQYVVDAIAAFYR